jgi:hypothetical protein
MKTTAFMITILGTFYPLGCANADQLCKTIADCARLALEQATAARKALKMAVPPGAIMAFDLPQCPVGWVPFGPGAGRVLIDAGNSGTPGSTNLKPGDKGGTQQITLSVAQLPPHAFTYQDYGSLPSGSCAYSGCSGRSGDRTRTTNTLGNGQPINNMQPYYVVSYCERR